MNSEKDLGVIFNNTLSFEDHIVSKVKKANSMVGMIKRSYLSPEIFQTLYISFVRPHLEYGQAVWSPKLCKHINLIETVQRRATRLVGGLRRCSYEDRLKKIGMPTLKFRRDTGDLIEVYKH